MFAFSRLDDDGGLPDRLVSVPDEIA